MPAWLSAMRAGSGRENEADSDRQDPARMVAMAKNSMLGRLNLPATSPSFKQPPAATRTHVSPNTP